MYILVLKTGKGKFTMFGQESRRYTSGGNLEEDVIRVNPFPFL